MFPRISSSLRVALLVVGTLGASACTAPVSLDAPLIDAPQIQSDEPTDQPAATQAAERTEVRAALAKARDAHLAQLKAYAKAGVFPTNALVPRTANIFRDAAGHLCAVANLIHQDGLDDLVDRTAKSQNLVILADLKTGELVDWIASSGFLREEIAQIQAPYVPLKPREEPGAAAARERARLVARLNSVIQQLEHDREASLDEATTRRLTVLAHA